MGIQCLSGLKCQSIRVFAVISLLVMLMPAPALSAWIDTRESNGIVYFLYDSPAQIKRYDLASETFLPLISPTTANPATAFNVDEDGIYVAFGRSSNHYSLTGVSIGSLGNANDDVTDIVSNDTHVFLHNNSVVRSVLKSSRAQVDSEDYHYSVTGMSLSRSQNRIFARTVGISPADINYIEVALDGTFDTTFLQVDSPYHGAYPSASETFLFPNESRIADNAGIVYATSDLTFSNSLGGAIDDLTFYGDLPIVLRDGKLISYSNAFLVTGNFEYSSEDVQQIAFYDDAVFGFHEPAAGNLQTVKTDISNLTPDEPGTPVSPAGLEYTPDSLAVDINGIAYLLSTAHQSIFRWSMPDQTYLTTIPLLGAPKFMAYSGDNHSLYVAYEDGTINKIEIDDSISEEGFAVLPQQALGLSTANSYVFAVDPSGAWVSHYTFDSLGSVVSAVEWNYFSTEYIWSDTNQKMYFFRDDTSPNDLLWEDIAANGVIGSKYDSPYHSSSGILHPIRVAPDGSVVVLGSGRIYDAISLSQTSSLANNIVDAVWLAGELLTLKDTDSNTVIQEWDAANSYSLEPEVTVDGEPFGFIQAEVAGENWLSVVSIEMGYPVFRPIQMANSLDIDADNVANIVDNCMYTANESQEDSTDDRFGDACALDYDNDGILNNVDNCPLHPNSDQAITNGSSNGDACIFGSAGIAFGGGSGGGTVDESENNFLLDLMPGILAAIKKEIEIDPEWGAFNDLCCPSSSTTFTVSEGGTFRSSTVSSCSADATFAGYANSTTGTKAFSSTLTSAACGNYSIPFRLDLESNTRYLAVSGIEGSSIVVRIFSEEINQQQSQQQSVNRQNQTTNIGEIKQNMKLVMEFRKELEEN